MRFHRTGVVSVLGLALMPSLASASGNFNSLSQLFDGSFSVQSLRESYRAIRQSPLMNQLLRDSGVHALAARSSAQSFGVQTTKYQHYYRGIEVLGSMSFFHESAAGNQVRNEINQFDLNTSPSLSADEAAVIARSIAGDRMLAKAPELKILPSAHDNSARLIYWVDVANNHLTAGQDILIDAHTGAVVAALSKMHTFTAVPVQVVSAKDMGLKVVPILRNNPVTDRPEVTGCRVTDMAKNATSTMDMPTCRSVVRGEHPITADQCQLVIGSPEGSGSDAAEPVALDPGACAQVVAYGQVTPQADSSARNALANSVKVLDYYKNTHGRNSFDGNGAEVVNVVHAGIQFANAAWVQGADFMLYGDGDGEALGDMTLGLDVAGHEMTHGVVSKTANFSAMYEAGALNEAYADFFGKMIAQDGTWMMGESLSLNPEIFPGIRDLSNPGRLSSRLPDGAGVVARRRYPSKVSEQIVKLDETTCNDENDYCWVHFNSTVPSHAAYLVHEAIGKAKAEKLYYLTLTQYLTSEATFRKSAEATMSACGALYDNATCAKVRRAFVQTGML